MRTTVNSALALAVRSLILVAIAAVPLALAAATSVPTSRAGTHRQPITVNDVKPNACDSITLTKIVEGSLLIAGGADAELILGGLLLDTISGAGGNDCIMGGDLDDTLDGGLGTDVCIGGPGIDTFTACETVIQET